MRGKWKLLNVAGVVIRQFDDEASIVLIHIKANHIVSEFLRGVNLHFTK